MKKIILVLACLIAVAAMPMTAMAHGHSGRYSGGYNGGNTGYGTYGTCGRAGCTIAGAHQHNYSYHSGGYHH